MSFPTNFPKRPRGFTLIEIMIVVAIVAILAAVALPSYKSYVLKTRRADALSTLTQTQAILERCYAQTLSYAVACSDTPTFPFTSAQAFYNISLSNQTATTYTLTATTMNAQIADTTCKTMTLDQANQKSAADSSSTAQSVCWNP